MITFQVSGLDRAAQELRALADRLGSGHDLEVRWVAGGPSAPYALYVHENMLANHPRGGSAQFIVRPLLEAVPTLAARIAARIAGGASIAAGLYTEAELLLTAMKGTTPVEYGALRNSEHVEGP